ncbi:MAG: Ycf66 family protein [Waterburya sp.]
MVNLGGGPAFILGLFLAIAGAGLFFLRSVRPELARDYDIFFAAVGLLCGIILIFNGWRLDPILQFSQFLLTGTAVFFAFESVRMRSVATEQARKSTATVDRDRPVSRSRVYTEAELDKIDPYDNVYEGAEPNYSSPRLRGYDDPAPRTNRRPASRNRSTPAADMRDEPRGRAPRRRPETRDSVARDIQGDYPTGTSRDETTRPLRDRYGNDEPNSRPAPRRPAATARDAYDEWDDVPKPTSRPRRPAAPPDNSYGERNSNPGRESYTPPPEPRRRPNPADLGRSYEPEEDYPSNDSGDSYDDSDLGRSYEDESKPIPGDYVVDYQPLDNGGTDYADDNYDDSPQDDYDDYNDSENSDSEQDDYDDYNDSPQRRTPINFKNDYD